MGNTKTGVELIAEERERQIEIEKWDYSHDADYKNGELIGAAGCYVANALNKDRDYEFAKFKIKKFAEGFISMRAAGWCDGWPWSKEWDKRKKHDKMKSLVIAGALIAAEIDRLNHLQNNKE